MSNYIKSEFYRLMKGKWTYLFILLCSGLLLSSNVILALVKQSDPTFTYATTAFSFANFYTSMIMVYLLCISVASIVFGNEYGNHTMKNSVSYGISRGTIYFGKFIVQIVYALIAFLIITGIHVISGYLLLENSGPKEFEMLLRTFFVCLPLFLFALAVTNCFAFIIESTGASVSAVVGIVLVLPYISNFLGMKFKIFSSLAKILPWNMINSISYDFENHLIFFNWDLDVAYRMFWIAGILEMAIIIMIGFMVYRKKEIK
jgi:ABC-type transport system involved in multi-copper enzyme maturation permease subunit